MERGVVRDAILDVMGSDPFEPLAISEITDRCQTALGSAVPPSSIRSYLAANTPKVFTRTANGHYALANACDSFDHAVIGASTIYCADAFDWMRLAPRNSISAVVTDPPYGLVEYSEKEKEKLRIGHGGVWRLPPSFDGCKRSPLPRFTVLTDEQRDGLYRFFLAWGNLIYPILKPGAHILMASNPLLSHIVSRALEDAGLERRGEVIRLVQTLRGGDKPKNHEKEYPDVTVMPRSQWEPWLLYRKPCEGTVAENLRKWGTGGLRRIDRDKPFGDVIKSSPTNAREKRIAPHPSLKPQSFMREVVRAMLPLGNGTVLDPFAGSGSTLAAANHVGYESIGVEMDRGYFELAKNSIDPLSRL